MNRNYIDDRWRQCHWEEWREIRNRWDQVRKTGKEPNQQSERVRGAELERRAQLVPSSIATVQLHHFRLLVWRPFVQPLGLSHRSRCKPRVRDFSPGCDT